MSTDDKRKQSSDAERNAPAKSKEGVEGEGSYSATRMYDADLEKALQEQDTDALAEAARKALEGPERASLEEAEKKGKSRRKD